MDVRKALEGTWNRTMWVRLGVPMEWLETGGQVSMVRWRNEWLVAMMVVWSMERTDCKEQNQ